VIRDKKKVHWDTKNVLSDANTCSVIQKRAKNVLRDKKKSTGIQKRAQGYKKTVQLDNNTVFFYIPSLTLISPAAQVALLQTL
jgi:hypothetical protein